MPEHFHLLITESEHGTPPLVMQVLKQRVSRACRKKKRGSKQLGIWPEDETPAFWQRRYYDFSVYSQRKHIEKLRYMHRNPVKQGLVESPELWRWSSYRQYRFGETGPVKIVLKPTLCCAKGRAPAPWWEPAERQATRQQHQLRNDRDVRA